MAHRLQAVRQQKMLTERAEELTTKAKFALGQGREDLAEAALSRQVDFEAQAKELAVIAQDGLTRAIYPSHTTLDGDTVFAAATGRRPLADAVNELTELGTVAANTLARAVARGVFEARSRPGGLPSWRDRFGK